MLTDEAHMPATTLPNAISYEVIDRGRIARVRLARLRREHCQLALLHVRHDRRSERGALQSSLDAAALLCLGAARCRTACPATTSSCPSCRCFMSTRGACRTPVRWWARSWFSRARRWAIQRRCRALIEAKQVTFAAGVPTVWQGMIAYLEKTGKRLESLKRVLCGGSAVPIVAHGSAAGSLRRATSCTRGA